jgi:hypothetical protein
MFLSFGPTVSVFGYLDCRRWESRRGPDLLGGIYPMGDASASR